MNRTADNKRPIEQILVVAAGATTTQSGGETLINSGTGLVDLNEGEILVLSSKGYGTVASNVAIAPADTLTASPEIFIVRGNSNANNPFAQETYPLTTRPYEKTEPINGNNKMVYTYKSAVRPEFDIWVVGDTVGNAGAINIEDETEYALKLAFFGREIDEAYGGAQKPAATTPSYVSKDYTTLGHTDAEATDDIIQNLAYKANLNSSILKFNKASYGTRKPFVALAIDSTGANGVSIKSLTPGTFVPVVNTSIGLRGFTVTWDIIRSFDNATSELPAAATVVPIDLTLAGDAAAAGTDLVSPSGGAYTNGFEGTLTFTGLALATETVTVGTKVYKFEAVPGAVDGDVDIGTTAAECADNLVAAINLDPADASLYGTGTVAQPEGIRARRGPGATVILSGSAGSTSTETLTNGSFGAATLQAVNRVSGKADQIAFVPLDRVPSFEDRIPYTKTRVDVGLLDGFNSDTVQSEKVQSANEGQGTSRQWTIMYDNTARQRQYDQYRGFEDLKIRYDNPVVDGTFYDACILEHYHFDLAGTNTAVKPLKSIILIPNAEAATNGVLTPDAQSLATITTVLQPWVVSGAGSIVSVLD